ncbi:MAG: hypothetical protein U0872_04235 [Planctomycetaceae bacterium]
MPLRFGGPAWRLSIHNAWCSKPFPGKEIDSRSAMSISRWMASDALWWGRGQGRGRHGARS